MDFQAAQDFSKQIIQDHSKRVQRVKDYEAIYHLDWDFTPPEGDWVMKLPSPQPNSAVTAVGRMIYRAKPVIEVMADAASSDFKDRAELIARSLLRYSDRRGPFRVSLDLGISAALAGEVYVQVLNVEDNIKFLEDSGQGGLAKRYRELAKTRPFIYRVHNARSVFADFSELGIEKVVLCMERSPSSVKSFWGDKASKGIAAAEMSGGSMSPTVKFYDYWDYDKRYVWVEGVTTPIHEQENDLGFIPWACSLAEGSTLFQDIEDQRHPMLYSVKKSGYFHAQSYADSIMYSLAVNLGKLPQIVANLENPKSTRVKEITDWSTPLGVIKLNINEKVTPLDKKVIDDSLQVAKQIADNRVTEMLLPKQVYGQEPENVMAYAALNELVTTGRLALAPVEGCVAQAEAQMFEIPFKWAKARDRVYEIPCPEEGGLKIDPAEYESVSFDVEINTSFAADDPRRIATAMNAVNAAIWSYDRAMTYTGVDMPARERAKIEDDIEWRSKFMAKVQGQSQAIAQAAVTTYLQGIGQSRNPMEVGYRPGEDHWRLCGNCAFFNGPGVPCKVVNAPIDPKYTCNEWMPQEMMKGGMLGQNLGSGQDSLKPPGTPSLIDPNQNQGGGGVVPAQVMPDTSFEGSTGMDRGGRPTGMR